MQQHNWQQLINDLRDAGLTLKHIGNAIGLTIGSVHDLSSGRTVEPKGSAAAGLIELHRKQFGKRRK
jgi:hypothetical protein